jgi:hypothetical protein
MPISIDFREFIELLRSERVEYVVVGAYAVAWHGHPRYTSDLDLLVRASPENAERVVNVLRAFGFGSPGLKAADFTTPGMRPGAGGRRGTSGRAPMIGPGELLRNKECTGRTERPSRRRRVAQMLL